MVSFLGERAKEGDDTATRSKAIVSGVALFKEINKSSPFDFHEKGDLTDETA